MRALQPEPIEADVVGVDHVSIGSDQQVRPGSLQDYTQWVELVAAMLRGGFTPEEAGMIAGGNYMRIFAASAIGLTALLVLEPTAVFLLLTTVVTVGGPVVGTIASVFWLTRLLRRGGLRVRFGQA